MHGTIRAIRGAVQVAADDPELIIRATEELLTTVLAANHLVADNLISLFFTATPDLRSAFPAAAARRLGLADTPLMCACEIDVPDAMPQVVRLLAQVDFGAAPPEKVRHIYLHGAEKLRPDLADAGARPASSAGS
jgi:chorismate mutase